MEKKIYPRIIRTYKLLTDSLMELLSEKKFEDIQVAEICERATIRRATFYKHFGDKYELFTYMIKEIQEEFDKNNAMDYDANRPQTYYISMISQTFTFVEQNKVMITSIVNSSACHILMDLLAEQIELDARAKLKADEKRGAVLPGNPDYLAPILAGALTYMARWWVLHDWRPDKEKIINESIRLLKIM